MTEYNSTEFDPPAPVAYVTLQNGDTGIEWSDVPMQLDSGEDITLVPQEAVRQLNLTVAPNAYYELAGFDGHTSIAAMVRLELIFCLRTFRGQFLLIDQHWGILGRNVLNNVPLLLDGPHLRWREHGREQ
jgi:hypothetical protein